MDLRAVIFVPALVAAALCVFAFLTFAAQYYLTVLESTAAGAREVVWGGDSITDAFWKPFYLGWLLCLWLGPAYVVGRTLAGSTGAAWLGLAVPVFVAWALYPVSQLSSLSASSMWMPLHPQVFARLAQKPAVVAGFFLFSLLLFALGGVAFRWAFLTSGEWYLLFVGIPLLALAGLLYARMLGRLAFALMFTKDILKRKKKKKPKRAKEKSLAESAAEEPEPVAVQPSEMAPIDTPDGELVGYNVLVADDPPRPKKRVKAEVAEDDAPEPEPEARTAKPPPLPRHARADAADDDATPYTVNPAEEQPEEHAPERVIKPTAEDMALLERRDAPKPPKRVWTAELFAFFAQPGTISAMVVLCGVGVLAGAAVRVARMFNPVAGGE